MNVRRELAKVGLTLGACLVTLLVIELGFRLFMDEPRVTEVSEDRYPDNPRGYFEPCGDEYCVTKSIADCSDLGGSPYVLFVGDSFTEGIGVRDPDVMSALLTFDDHRTMNCAMSGNSLGDVMQGVERMTGAYRPDLTVYGLVLNDLDPGPGNAAYGIGCGSAKGDNPGRNDYVTIANAGWAEWQAEREAELGWSSIFLHSHVVRWFWLRQLANTVSVDTETWYRNCFKSGPELTKSLDAVATLAKGQKRFIVMLWPLFVRLDEYPFKDIHKRLASGLKERGVEVLDLLTVFEGQPTDELYVHIMDRHPNEIAHKMAADALADRLKSLGWLTPVLD